MTNSPNDVLRLARLPGTSSCALRFVLPAVLLSCLSCQESPTRPPWSPVPIDGNSAPLADELPRIENIASIAVQSGFSSLSNPVSGQLPKEKWPALMKMFQNTQAVKVYLGYSITGNLEILQNDGKKCDVYLFAGGKGQVILQPHEGGSRYGGYYRATITNDSIWRDLPIIDDRPHSDIRLRITIVGISVLGAVIWLATRKRFTLRDLFWTLIALACAINLALYFLAT